MPLLPKGGSVYAGRKAGVEDSPQNIMHKPEVSFILWKCYDNWYDTNAQSYLQVKSCFSCYITKQQMGTFEVSSRWQTKPRKSQQSTEDLHVHGILKQYFLSFTFVLLRATFHLMVSIKLWRNSLPLQRNRSWITRAKPFQINLMQWKKNRKTLWGKIAPKV